MVTKQLITPNGVDVPEIPESTPPCYLNATCEDIQDSEQRSWKIQINCFLPTKEKEDISIFAGGKNTRELIPAMVYTLSCNGPIIGPTYFLWHITLEEALDRVYNMVEVEVWTGDDTGETLRGARTVSKTFIRPDVRC